VLRESSRPSDVVARLGGDEFAVLVTVPPDGLPDDQQQWWERYVARLAGRLAAADCPASLGHSARREQDAPDQGLVEAWRRADAAMYAEKAAHRRAGNSPR
jgi:GGDEF domain-containing protein